MELARYVGNGDITSLESWFTYAPPMGAEKQWRDGRSAKELARYITDSLPAVPTDVGALLGNFTAKGETFDWAAEYVTDFAHYGFGRGMGRNHDAVIFNKDIFVGIEAKADEPFGDKTVSEELEKASTNKALRINKLTELIFGDSAENHPSLRYQLLTACGGVLLEAIERKINNAMLLVLVFLKSGHDQHGKPYYTEENRIRNNQDWDEFLSQIKAERTPEGYWKVPPCGAYSAINLYVHKLEIHIP